MGKQINYYMSEAVQNNFIEYLKENEFILLDKNANEVLYEDYMKYWRLYIYKDYFGNLFFYEGEIDVFESPVIEFIKTAYKEKTVIAGRIWVPTDYYLKNKKISESKKYIDEYSSLSRWIKKNVPYKSVPKGNHFVKAYINNEILAYADDGFRFI